MGDQYEDAQRRLREYAKQVRSDTYMLLSQHRMTGLVPRAMLNRPVMIACKVVSSKSVHNAAYGHMLGEEMKELSRGNTADKYLAKALGKMLDLAGAVDPATVERIPRDIEGCMLLDIGSRMGVSCSTLNEPLLTFVFTGYEEPGAGKLENNYVGPNDIELQFDDSDAYSRLREATKQALSDYNMLFSQNQMAAFIPKATMERAAKVASTVLVSKYVHDTVYRHALGEEIKVLSRGNQAEKDLALALYNMRYLAETVNPDTIERIPREIEGCNLSTIAARIGNGCRILNEPLLNFVFTAYNEPGVGELRIKNANPALPVNSSMFSVEANLALAAIGVAMAGGVMASGAAKDSPYVRFFAAAELLGINASLLAALKRKNPWLSGCLTNAGGIGVSSAIVIALGNTIDTAAYGNVNVISLVIGLICLVNMVLILG